MSNFQTIHGQSAYLDFEFWLCFINLRFSLDIKMLQGVTFVQRKRSPITHESLAQRVVLKSSKGCPRQV
jgi:hypothetical protein